MHELELEIAFSHGTAWSPKANCSSSAELEDCHILMLAPSDNDEHVKAVSNFMKDAVDGKEIWSLIERVNEDEGEAIQVFAKS